MHCKPIFWWSIIYGYEGVREAWNGRECNAKVKL
jgi:hypothetical protein